MFNWKKLVASVAPVLGSALGGPLGGVAATTIAKALGLNDSNEATLETTLQSATPDTLLKLKEADHTFKLDMQKLGVNLEQIAMEDRKSAREREVAVKDRFPAILATILIVGFLGILFYMLHFPIPEGVRSVADIMVGAVGGLAASPVTYYFGSSYGSTMKNKWVDK